MTSLIQSTLLDIKESEIIVSTGPVHNVLHCETKESENDFAFLKMRSRFNGEILCVKARKVGRHSMQYVEISREFISVSLIKQA